jgi:hypothetical protein
MPQQSRHRNWVFTLNFDPLDYEFGRPELPALPAGAKYLVYQHERGEQDHDHYQGYIELRAPQSLGWLKRNVLDRAHFEPRRGNADQARAYAMKEESRVAGPWEFGEYVPPNPGRRTDIEAIHQQLVANVPVPDIIREHATALRLIRNLVAAQGLLAPSRRQFDPDVKVVVYWGEPGMGKTRRAYADAGEDYYLKSPSNKWWDGYTGQSTVIVDDYGGDRMESKWGVADFKQWTDKYPVTLEVKGGVVRANWKLLIFTSNYEPAHWYHDNGPILRRIDKTVYFGNDINMQIIYPDN